MNQKMKEYNAQRLITYCIQKSAEQGTDTARITTREVAEDLGMARETICESENYLENIGVAYFRKKAGSRNGTIVTFDDNKLAEYLQKKDNKKRTESEIDDYVYDVLTDLGKTGKQFVLLAKDIKDHDIGPIETGKSLERLAAKGLIVSRPIIIDEKWLVKICEGEPEPTPQEKPVERSHCPKCGTPLPEGAKFCFMCGERLPKTEMEQLKDRYMEVISRVARMYNNSDRANKDLEIMQKVGEMAFKGVA